MLRNVMMRVKTGMMMNAEKIWVGVVKGTFVVRLIPLSPPHYLKFPNSHAVQNAKSISHDGYTWRLRRECRMVQYLVCYEFTFVSEFVPTLITIHGEQYSFILVKTGFH